MSHILRTSTEHKTASLADEGLHIASLATHTTLNIYKPMELRTTMKGNKQIITLKT